jgi:adenylate cyclase
VNGGVNGGLDAWWLRERFTLREAVYGSERDSRIIIVGIDDRSLDKWPEPFILWGGHIADAINHLNRSGARVIALDWTQTTDVDQVFHIRNDEKLGAALNSAKGIVLVKILRPDGKYVYPVDSLRYALPDAANDGGESSLGYADVPSPTGIWTYIYPTIPGSGGRDVSFAARIAQKADSIDPTDVKVGSDGTMFVRFKGGTGFTEGGTFERVSLYDVATAKSPDPRWKDKIVLIGATYKGGNDNHYVPIMNGVVAISDLRLIPGVEAQAHAVATILDDAAIQEPPPMAIWLLAGFAGILGVGAYTQWNWGRAAFVMLGVLLGWTALSFVVFCTDNFALPLVAPLSTLLLGAAMMGGYRALSEERERAQVLRVWGKHKDPRIILELLEHPEWRGGEGEEVEVTVLFADLKNFTKTVEHLPPARALEVLNRYLALVSESIKKQGGVVDKYLGDGLMAQWGAPVPRQDHADAAVAACLDINERLCTLSEELEGTGEIVFETRLTLHSGLVVAGNVGSDESLEYTIIGDTVNVTSRMQETAKQLDANFLISETTQASLKQPVALGRRSEVEIRGRQRPLVVHEVLCRAIKSPEVISPSKNGKESQEEHGGVTTAAETV